MLQKTDTTLSLEQAATKLLEAGSCLNEAEALELELYAQVEKLKKKARKVVRLRRKARGIGRSLYRFHMQRGRHLTDTRSLTLEMAGVIELSDTPPELVVRNIASAVKQIRKIGRMDDFVETTYTIRKNAVKEAFKQDPLLEKRLRSLSTKSRTICYMRPSNSKLHLERDPKDAGAISIRPRAKRKYAVLENSA